MKACKINNFNSTGRMKQSEKQMKECSLRRISNKYLHIVQVRLSMDRIGVAIAGGV